MAGPSLPFLIPIRAVDAVTGPMRRIRQAIGGSRMMGALKTVTGGIGSLLSSLAKGAVAFGVMAATATVSLLAIAKQTANRGDAIAKMAKQLGLSVEALQEFGFVAERSGVSQETFNQSMVAFTKRLGEAKAGTGSLNSFLQRVSPTLLDQLRATEDVEEALTFYLDAIGKVDDPTKRAALASAAFSRAGVRMVNIAAEGAEGIEALRQRARDLGMVMDEDATSGSEEFQDALLDLKVGLAGLRNTIGAAVMPVLTSLMNQLADLWVQHLPQVRNWISLVVAKAQELWGRLTELVGQFQGWREELGILVPIVGAALVGAFVGLGAAAVGAAIPVLTALAPILLIGAVIGTITALVILFWDELVFAAKVAWGWLTDLASDFWDWLTGRIDAFMAALPDFSDFVPDWFLDLFGGDDKKIELQASNRQLVKSTGSALEERRISETRAAVRVELPNLPRGATVQQSSSPGLDFDLDTGFATPGLVGGV